ncbi:MAG: tRNA (guanosine(46)-N7)-methyltransferase TrmB [Rhodobacteraceae bacterium]|nr:tRNA (guanosine(46)-N7)-methyltransferase TrmB [Paracoccaceae bacterium]
MPGDVQPAPSDPAQRRQVYGRLRGRPLRRAQAQSLHEDLPALSLGTLKQEKSPHECQELDLGSLFGTREIWLEIGFGSGEHLLHQALRHPHVGMIGCEPYLNGVASLLSKLRFHRLRNIRIHAGDVRDVLDVLPEGGVSRVFLLYPDPWPKKRHHRRRFMTPQYLAPLGRALRIGAELRLATDVADYVRQAQEQMPQHGFETLSHPAQRHMPWPDWLPTRYENKARRAGRVPYYLTFGKIK